MKLNFVNLFTAANTTLKENGLQPLDIFFWMSFLCYGYNPYSQRDGD